MQTENWLWKTVQTGREENENDAASSWKNAIWQFYLLSQQASEYEYCQCWSLGLQYCKKEKQSRTIFHSPGVAYHPDNPPFGELKTTTANRIDKYIARGPIKQLSKICSRLHFTDCYLRDLMVPTEWDRVLSTWIRNYQIRPRARQKNRRLWLEVVDQNRSVWSTTSKLSLPKELPSIEEALKLLAGASKRSVCGPIKQLSKICSRLHFTDCYLRDLMVPTEWDRVLSTWIRNYQIRPRA